MHRDTGAVSNRYTIVSNSIVCSARSRYLYVRGRSALSEINDLFRRFNGLFRLLFSPSLSVLPPGSASAFSRRRHAFPPPFIGRYIPKEQNYSVPLVPHITQNMFICNVPPEQTWTCARVGDWVSPGLPCEPRVVPYSSISGVRIGKTKVRELVDSKKLNVFYIPIGLRRKSKKKTKVIKNNIIYTTFCTHIWKNAA